MADLREISRDYELDRYNALLSVEDANAAIRTDDVIGDFLASASELFVRHDVQSRFGVALLHKHNTCDDGESMIQYAGTVNDETALITRPVTKVIDYGAEVPWVWALSDGQFYPMEFTTDKVARSLFTNERDVPAGFLDEFIDLSTRSPIGHLIGLAIVERALFEEIPGDCAAIEYTFPEERSNVIFVRERSGIPTSIETNWVFEGYVDPVLGCVSKSSCASSCRWECIVDYGKHSNLHFDHHTVQYSHEST
jgi:hypothetical protein